MKYLHALGLTAAILGTPQCEQEQKPVEPTVYAHASQLGSSPSAMHAGPDISHIVGNGAITVGEAYDHLDFTQRPEFASDIVTDLEHLTQVDPVYALFVQDYANRGGHVYGTDSQLSFHIPGSVPPTVVVGDGGRGSLQRRQRLVHELAHAYLDSGLMRQQDPHADIDEAASYLSDIAFVAREEPGNLIWKYMTAKRQAKSLLEAIGVGDYWRAANSEDPNDDHDYNADVAQKYAHIAVAYVLDREQKTDKLDDVIAASQFLQEMGSSNHQRIEEIKKEFEKKLHGN